MEPAAQSWPRSSPSETFLRSNQIASAFSRIDWDFPSYSWTPRTSGIHALHWYLAPFPLALAATVLDILVVDPGTRVNDPFCGSGVGVVEAWLRGADVTAGDLSPLAIQICKAKLALITGTVDVEALRDGVRTALDSQSSYLPAPDDPAFFASSSINPESAKWFDPKVLADIARVKAWIAELDAEARELAEVLLSAVLRQVSHLRAVHYTYIVDRTLPKTLPKDDVSVSSVLCSKIESMAAAARSVRADLTRAHAPIPTSQPRYWCRDVLTRESKVRVQSDLVFTSPPYFGMHDYIRSHYLSELILPIFSNDSLIEVEIGGRRDRRSPVAANRYIDHLSAWFAQLPHLLAPDGLLVLVVGETTAKLANQIQPLKALRAAADSAGLRILWEGERRSLLKKTNQRGRSLEMIWVMTR